RPMARAVLRGPCQPARPSVTGARPACWSLPQRSGRLDRGLFRCCVTRTTHMAAPNVDPAPNEPYQVVARRFRPQTFQEIVGQDDVLQSLRLSLEQQRVPHAFLFSGSRGVGKTTSARILARCLNCERGPTAEPCGTCEACRAILDG